MVNELDYFIDSRSTGVRTGIQLISYANNSGNHLTIQRSNDAESQIRHSFICRTCPYEFIVDKEYYNRRVSKVKKVDDILGGAAAWENVDQTRGIASLLQIIDLVPMCANRACEGTKAYYRQMQIRSADEPMTTFYKCVDCGTQWREN
jgi:DNA-directed RNA polymerase III subunit RPC11